MFITYIGPTQTMKCVSTDPQNVNTQINVELVHGEQYDIDIQQDGPQYIVNGQPMVHPDSTFWVVFSNGRAPYNQECLTKHWEVKL